MHERGPDRTASAPPGPVRRPLRLVADAADGQPGPTVARLLARMEATAFQGRKLGEAFRVWRRMLDDGALVCLGLAGSLASAGMAPLVVWLIERGYVDVVVSTSANVTEDLLEQMGVAFHQVDPDRIDDHDLWERGLYRFYDHVVAAADYDRMEDLTAGFFEYLAATVPAPVIPGVRFTFELGRWLADRALGGTIAAACARQRIPLFVPAAPDGPLAEGYRTARRKGPVVDFFRDYELLLATMAGYAAPGPGTAAIFLGGGVPKDFIQITATSACADRGGAAAPHVAAIQITTDNAVFGGLGGAGVGSEAISWGKESPGGANVMLFADVTIALPLLCQGLAEHYGAGHRRDVRSALRAALAGVLPA